MHTNIKNNKTTTETTIATTTIQQQFNCNKFKIKHIWKKFLMRLDLWTAVHYKKENEQKKPKAKKHNLSSEDWKEAKPETRLQSSILPNCNSTLKLFFRTNRKLPDSDSSRCPGCEGWPTSGPLNDQKSLEIKFYILGKWCK